MKLYKVFLAFVISVILAGCSMFGGDTSLNKNATAAQLSSGALFNTGAVLVNTCVIKPGTDVVTGLTAAFDGLAGTFDGMTADIKSGDTNGANVLLQTAIAALQQAQIHIAALQPTEAQSVKLRAATPKAAGGPKSLGAVAIIALVQQYLPIVLSGGAQIVDLVKGFINNIKAPDAEVVIADVEAANVSMHTALNNFHNAACAP